MSLRSILDYVRNFILFEEDGGKLIKKIAGYHQFHGVREAVRVTMIAAKPVDGTNLIEDRVDSFSAELGMSGTRASSA